VPWPILWKFLRLNKWRKEKAEVLGNGQAFQYVRPNRFGAGYGVRSVDYFVTKQGVFEFCEKHPEEIKGLFDKRWMDKVRVEDDDEEKDDLNDDDVMDLYAEWV
jgi:hypothetical protein